MQTSALIFLSSVGVDGSFDVADQSDTPSLEIKKLGDTDLTTRRREDTCAIAFSPGVQLLPATIKIPHEARMRQVTVRILKRLFLTLAFTGTEVQDVMIIPTAAAVMTPKVAQPIYLSNGEFTRLPITF